MDPERILNWAFDDVHQDYSEKDTILYALGVGLGMDPTDRRQLKFLYEADLSALPTMGVVLAGPGFWVRDLDTGIDWVRVLHGEQGITIHKPLPPAGQLVGKMHVTDLIDKGADKGALMYTERTLSDRATGDLLVTMTSTSFCRGDGGFGGPTKAAPRPHPIPDRDPDHVCDLPTLAQAALIYRLCADDNPLHIDPDVAIAAGFERPILHGLCTLGVAGHAILRTCCDYNPERMHGLSLRFSAPVYPGETIRTEMWTDGDTVSFRSSALDRGVVVLNNGTATIG